MKDRTGQVWQLGGRSIYLIVAEAEFDDDDPDDWELGLSGSLRHSALELQEGYMTVLVELTDNGWNKNGWHDRIL
jgi:hypothetical protein